MNRINRESFIHRAKARAKALAAKVGAASALSMVAFAASAQDAGYPTTLEGIQAWAEPKFAVAIALSILITCVVLALKINKTPRKA
jgi:hypothetical protein